MAIYHCSVKIIGRNSGRSSVAAAAYRAGEKLLNDYDGVEHDFTRKNWIEYKEILLPDQAPREYADRGTLWNAVEAAEKSKNAQLAREFELALPKEMNLEQQIEVVQSFSKFLIQEGMIADIVIHNPPVVNDRHQPIDVNGNVTMERERMQFINPHAHVMTTVRPIDLNGKWERKSEILYICKKGREEKAFTAKEFQIAKNEGWQKQYKYRIEKQGIWMTKSEGEQNNLKRINRSPKTEKYGRQNPQIAYWNDKDRILEWRKMWADVVNEKFKELQSDIQIDHRSFKDQGREDELPTIHMGTAATNLEKRADREIREGKDRIEAQRSELGDINREIKAYNGWIQKIKKKIEVIADKVINKLNHLGNQIKELENIGNQLEKDTRILGTKIQKIEYRMSQYNLEKEKISKANLNSEIKINSLKEELKQHSKIQFLKKREIQKQINEESNKIKQRNQYLKGIQEKYGYKKQDDYDAEFAQYQMEQTELRNNKEKLQNIYGEKEKLDEDLREQIRKISKEKYENIEKQLSNNIKEKMNNDRKYKKKITR